MLQLRTVGFQLRTVEMVEKRLDRVVPHQALSGMLGRHDIKIPGSNESKMFILWEPPGYF